MKFLLGLAIVIFLWLQYQLWLAPGGLVDIWHLKHQIVKEKKITHALDHRNDVIKADIQGLRQGDQAIEERARTDLGMIKPGETYYRIVKTQT